MTIVHEALSPTITSDLVLDKERLDWLEQGDNIANIVWETDGPLRPAIDNARKNASPTTTP